MDVYVNAADIDRNIHIDGHRFRATIAQANELKNLLDSAAGARWLTIGGTTIRVTDATAVSITPHIGDRGVLTGYDLRDAEKPFTIE